MKIEQANRMNDNLIIRMKETENLVRLFRTELEIEHR
jgi:hypothetical protein